MSADFVSRASSGTPAPRDSFVVRSWNGQTIRMRAGRVCLTDLCKAGETGNGNPIRFSHWFESEATQRFLQHRSAVTGRDVFAISPVIDNAENSALIVRESERGDAWGDEVVSLKLAGRLCTELEHEIYQWYAETRVSQVRDTPPALPDPLTTVERSLGLLERLGGLDDRAQHLLRDIVLNYAARSAGGEILLPPAARTLSLQEALRELAGATPQEATKIASKQGKLVKQVYRDENGRVPKTHKQIVNGRSCDVCDYEVEWLNSHHGDLVELVETFRANAG